MVKPTLVITADGPADGELVHRFRNFAEDLLREFLRRGAARVENPDSGDGSARDSGVGTASPRSNCA